MKSSSRCVPEMSVIAAGSSSPRGGNAQRRLTAGPVQTFLQSAKGQMPVLPDGLAIKPACQTWITIFVTSAKTVCALDEKDREDASCFVSPVSSLIFSFRPFCSYESGLDLTSVFIEQPSLQMRPLLTHLKFYVISNTA